MRNLFIWGLFIFIAFLFYRSWKNAEESKLAPTEPKTPATIVNSTNDPHGRAGEWTQDYAAAANEASLAKRPLLILFTGSDWCVWCQKLEKEVFSQKEFLDYAKTNLILFKADFPQKIHQTLSLKKQNQDLAQKYGINGFPTVLIMDSTGEKVLGKTGYRDGGAASYVEHIKGMVK